MADRNNYYFKQLVEEDELDSGFEKLEAADRAIVDDFAMHGVASGTAVTEQSPQDLTVNIAAGACYDKLGQRIAWTETQIVDVSEDENSISTEPSPGNLKIVSVFAKFDRLLTDPRIDGASVTVYFDVAETVEFIVRQGAEHPTTPVPVDVDPEYILLCDIERSNGDTTIANADIDETRKEWTFKLSGSPQAIAVGTPEEAAQALLDAYNDHVGGTDQHAAADVTYAGSPNWNNGAPLAATDVEAALDEIVSDLASEATANGSMLIGSYGITSFWYDTTALAAGSIYEQFQQIGSDISSTGSTCGAQLIGCKARTTWLGGRTNPADVSVYAAIDKIITDLAAVTAFDDGAERIGSAAFSGHILLTESSVRHQIETIAYCAAAINQTNTFTEAQTFLDYVVFDADNYEEVPEIHVTKKAGVVGLPGVNLTVKAGEGADHSSGTGGDGGSLILTPGQPGTGTAADGNYGPIHQDFSDLSGSHKRYVRTASVEYDATATFAITLGTEFEHVAMVEARVLAYHSTGTGSILRMATIANSGGGIAVVGADTNIFAASGITFSVDITATSGHYDVEVYNGESGATIDVLVFIDEYLFDKDA